MTWNGPCRIDGKYSQIILLASELTYEFTKRKLLLNYGMDDKTQEDEENYNASGGNERK